MRWTRTLWLCAALAAPLTGCKISVSSDNGRRLEGAGVAFVVPMESGKAEFGPAGINYRSNTITASTDGKQLIVNGTSFGTLQAGDVVNLTNASAIKVNDQPRVASSQ